ncbi:unnamed protein product, partial [Laminaria digitata]
RRRELGRRVLEGGAHLAAARAIRRHSRSEETLVAGMRALETIALTCGRTGKASVQTLHIPYPNPNPNPSSEGYLAPGGKTIHRPDLDSGYTDSPSDSSCTAFDDSTAGSS